MNTPAPTPTENAAEHTARSKRTCARLAELAMQMAEIIAAKTIAEQAAAPQPSADPDPKSADARKHADPTLQFNRLARIVLDCIAFESQLDAVSPSSRPTHKPASPHHNPVPPAPRRSLADSPEFIALRSKLDKAIASDHAAGRRADTAKNACILSQQSTKPGFTLAPRATASP